MQFYINKVQFPQEPHNAVSTAHHSLRAETNAFHFCISIFSKDFVAIGKKWSRILTKDAIKRVEVDNNESQSGF